MILPQVCLVLRTLFQTQLSLGYMQIAALAILLLGVRCLIQSMIQWQI